MPGRFERIMRDIDRGLMDGEIARKYRGMSRWDARMYRKVHDGQISPGHDRLPEERGGRT